MSSKKKHADQNDTRAAVSELIAELDRTRKEYAKATLQLTQLETAVQHLKDAEVKKDQIVKHLERDLESTKESHAHSVAVSEEEYKTKETSWNHRVKFLEMEVQRLTNENEAYSAFEKENRQLRDTVLEHQSVIERLQQVNDDLRARAKDDSHEYAQQLEAEFKRRLADSEKRFRAEAYRALSEEAKIALQGNDHLQTVLQRQNDSIEAVLLRCKQLEQSHSKVKQEQDLAQQNLSHHVMEINRLKKQLGDSKSKNTQLEEALKQRKVERASLELLFIEYEATRKQLSKANDKARRALREAERWKARAVQLTHELGEGAEREAAERMLERIHKQTEDAEVHVRRKRVNAERKAKTKATAAEGAALLREAVEDDRDWSDVEEIDEHVEQDDPTMGREINPMEILSMWNVNFENWAVASPTGQRGGKDLIGESSEVPPEDSYPSMEPSMPNIAAQPSQSIQQSASQQQQQQQGDGQQPMPQSPSQPAHVKQGVSSPRVQQQTATMQRLMADKNLSVLSRRRGANVPPHLARQARKANKRHKVDFHELSIVTGGEHKTHQAQDPASKDGSRFIVP